MLVLCREVGQKIIMSHDGVKITLIVVEIKGDKRVRFGIDAPREVEILRDDAKQLVPKAPEAV